LARWLHPDRNPDQWEAVFAERVNGAWQDLRTSERRARYLPAQEASDEWSAVVATPPVRGFARVENPENPPQRSRDLRWVPSAVVATLGSVAIVMLVLVSSTHRARPDAPIVYTMPEAPEVPARLTPQPPPPPVAAPEVVAVVESLPAPVEASDSRAPVPAAQAEPFPEPMVPTPEPEVAPTKPPKVLVEVAPRTVEPVSKPMDPPAAEAPKHVRTPPAAAIRTVQVPMPDSRDANRLLGQFSRAYEEGDMQGMRALFAADARGPAGGLDEILADYRRLFNDSRERSLSVRDVSWFVSGETFTIVASFDASLTSGRVGRVRRTRGDLRLDLRREGDHWQIFRMKHGERPG
jgi:hypothetical protein